MYNKFNMNSGSHKAALLQHCVWSLYWAHSGMNMIHGWCLWILDIMLQIAGLGN